MISVGPPSLKYDYGWMIIIITISTLKTRHGHRPLQQIGTVVASMQGYPQTFEHIRTTDVLRTRSGQGCVGLACQWHAGFLGQCVRRSRIRERIMNVAQIKDEIRYLSRSDKIEIYRWLDRELAGDLRYRIGSHRSIAIRQEIERTWKENRNSEQPHR